MNPPNHIETFRREAEDLLAEIEETCLALDPVRPSADAINRLFRAFHTIKGSGAMFGFDAVAEFTHHVENALDQVRAGTIAVGPDFPKHLLAARDHIAGLLVAAGPDDAPPASQGEWIVAALAARPSSPAVRSPDAAPATAAPQTFHIRFRPPADLMAAGTNPATLLHELRGLGDCHVTAQLDAIPPLEELQAAPDRCHFRWAITLTTDRGLNAIRDVFIFVEDGSELAIEPSTPVTPAIDDEAVHAAAPVVAAFPASAPAAASSAARAKRDATVRVPSERLDRLVALVGEFVMNQSRLLRASQRHHDDDLASPVEAIERLVDELRDCVLGIRMMPIGSTFGRFKRLVHDLSAELGKEIDLATEGADTEVDKTVLDQLGDPLVHLIRNSLDHGIESAAARTAAGKPPRGLLRLAAAHSGSNVVVTIQDDGRGLDAAAIRAKAIEKQLVAPDATLGPAEIFQLILLPGFSTAKTITNVSGRGVGMDVVKRQIEALRGTIQLASEPGRGTTVTLTLPLTLAIIEGLLVEVAGDRFILPMASVLETIELTRAERQRRNGRNVAAVRGELVPFVRLRDLFSSEDDGPALEKIVVVRHDRERVGIAVDRVLGSHQTVIQSLGRFYRHLEVASGATILGDGRVALILDLAGLVRTAGRAAAARRTAA